MLPLRNRWFVVELLVFTSLVCDVTAVIPNQTAIVIGSLIGGLLFVCCALALVYIWVSRVTQVRIY